MPRCQHCGQGAIAQDRSGPVCPDCWDAGYQDVAKPVEAKPENYEDDFSHGLDTALSIIHSEIGFVDCEGDPDDEYAGLKRAEKLILKARQEYVKGMKK